MTSKFPEFVNYYTRNFSDNDLELVCKLRSNSQVQKHHPDGIFRRSKAEKYFWQLRHHQQKHNFSYLPIFEKSSDKFVGICGLMFFDSAAENFSEGVIEIGYAIMPEFWGKGVATLISQGFITWGFANLPITKIIAVCNSLNIGSLKVIKKLGGKYIKTTINPRVGDEVELYEICK